MTENNEASPKENKMKYGLWEDGKRIEWFNEEQV